MLGIIYVAHGSKKPGKNEQMSIFVDSLKKTQTTEFQALAYLENDPETIVNVATRFIKQGVDELLIVPLLLFDAMHLGEDVPDQINLVKNQYPQVSIKVSEAFAQEPEIRHLLVQRYKEKIVNPNPNLKVLLIAHGSSSYSRPSEVVSEIAKRLGEDLNQVIDVGLLYGQPHYIEQAEVLLMTESDILILPLFLFSGHLLDKIKLELAHLSKQDGQVMYAEPLQLDKQLIPAITRLMKRSLADG